MTPIAIKTADEGNWSGATKDGKTTITVTPTENPASALMHELLHAKLKNSGYRQYLAVVSMDEKHDDLLKIALIFDNELQHHRMYSEYVAAGLDLAHFYHDDDVGAFAHVRAELKRMHKHDPPEEFFRVFVTLIAPGGAGTEEERHELRELFRNKCRAKTWTILTKIEQAFEEWAKSDSLDPGPTIVRILQVFGDYRKSWIGFGANSLEDGIFVGAKFTEQDAREWFVHRRPELTGSAAAR